MSFPGTRRIAGWLFWLVFPALSVLAIVYASISLSDHLGEPSGALHGSFTVDHRGCENHLCTVTGTFLSDDGFTTYAQVPGDARWVTGRSYPAYFSRGMYEADPVAQGWDPTTSVLALAGALAYLAVLSWLGIASLREGAFKRGSLQQEPNRAVQSG